MKAIKLVLFLISSALLIANLCNLVPTYFHYESVTNVVLKDHHRCPVITFCLIHDQSELRFESVITFVSLDYEVKQLASDDAQCYQMIIKNPTFTNMTISFQNNTNYVTIFTEGHDDSFYLIPLISLESGSDADGRLVVLSIVVNYDINDNSNEIITLHSSSRITIKNTIKFEVAYPVIEIYHKLKLPFDVFLAYLAGILGTMYGFNVSRLASIITIRNRPKLGRIIKFLNYVICLIMCSWQFIEFSNTYFSYKVVTEASLGRKLHFPNLPAFQICLDPSPELFNRTSFDAAQLVNNHKSNGLKPLKFGDIISQLVMCGLGGNQIFHDSNNVNYFGFTFIQDMKPCYQFKPEYSFIDLPTTEQLYFIVFKENELEKMNYSGKAEFALSTDKYYKPDDITGMYIPTPPFKFLNVMIYEYIIQELLPPPYKSGCKDYIRERWSCRQECIDSCIIKKVKEMGGHLHPSSVPLEGNHNDITFVTHTDYLKEQCIKSVCKPPACSNEIYHLRKLFEGRDLPSVAVELASTEIKQVVKPEMTIGTYAIFIANIFGLWFGCHLAQPFEIIIRMCRRKVTILKKAKPCLYTIMFMISLFHCYFMTLVYMDYEVVTQTTLSRPTNFTLPPIAICDGIWRDLETTKLKIKSIKIHGSTELIFTKSNMTMILNHHSYLLFLDDICHELYFHANYTFNYYDIANNDHKLLQIKLNDREGRGYRIYFLGSLDYNSVSMEGQNNLYSPFVDIFIPYQSLHQSLLQIPYKPSCHPYLSNRKQLEDECIMEGHWKKHGILPQHLRMPINDTRLRRNNFLDNRIKINCKIKYAKPECNTVLYKSRYDNKPTEGQWDITVTNNELETKIVYMPQMDFFELLIQLTAILGLWFGFSVYGLLSFIFLCKRSQRKQSDTIRVEPVIQLRTESDTIQDHYLSSNAWNETMVVSPSTHSDRAANPVYNHPFGVHSVAFDTQTRYC